MTDHPLEGLDETLEALRLGTQSHNRFRAYAVELLAQAGTPDPHCEVFAPVGHDL
jgi:hypothetical protein